MSAQLRQEIQTILNKKKIDNPAYSLRALSRDMGLSQSILSLYLRDKRPLTPFMAYCIGRYMKLNDSEILRLIVSTFR